MRIPINWLKEYVSVPKNISELTDKLTMAGHLLDKIDNIDDQTVIDLELRSNRADCYSIFGIARDVAALCGSKLTELELLPKIKIVKQLNNLHLTINPAFAKRVMMIKINDIVLTDSPAWMKEKLEAYGIPSINNIVDLTNFVMVETGQPMHVFDQDQIGNQLEIRLAKNNEKLLTFADDTIVLNNSDLVWANKKQVLSIAGAIGDKRPSISPQTKSILLEAANYDRANIRHTIHKHNLFTDAGIRLEKELDPNLVEIGIYRFLKILKDNKWGKIDTQMFDHYPKPIKFWSITLSIKKLENLTGVSIKLNGIKKILTNLNFEINSITKSSISVLIPTYRTDVVLEEDLVEEILRVHGYDQIPVKTLGLEIPTDVTPNFIGQEECLRHYMVELGFDEVISSSCVKEKSIPLDNLLWHQKGTPIKIINSPSPDFEHLRLSLLPNLYDFTKKIINERGLVSNLFEIGKIYFKQSNNYVEKRILGMIFWKQKGDFLSFKAVVEALLEKINVTKYWFDSTDNYLGQLVNTFCIKVDSNLVAQGGEIDNCFYLEIDLDQLLNKTASQTVKLWPAYPPQTKSYTIVIPPKTYVGRVINEIALSSKDIADISYKQDEYNRKGIYTLDVTYRSNIKTLTDEEVEKISREWLSKIKTKFSVDLK